MNEIAELAGAYREFFKGALGKDLMARVDAVYVKKLKSATKAGQEEAWGLLKEASGVDLVREEFKKVISLDQRGGGRT